MRLSEIWKKSEIWKIDPHYRRQKRSPGSLLSGRIRFLRISWWFRSEGPQTTVGWLEPAIFSNFGHRIFRTFRVEANIMTRSHEVAYRLSSDPKMTLIDLKMPCYAKICFVFVVSLTRSFCLAFEDNYVKTDKDTPILSATKMFTGDSSFWQYRP